MLSVNATTFEAVPRYHHLPRSVLCAQLRSAALAILATGQTVSVQRLRECGVRGATAALIALREELVAAGELPPEAAARVYARPVHPPGKASYQLGSNQRSAISSQQFNSSLTADKLIADCSRAECCPLTAPKLTRAQRRSRRLIRRYNSAVRRIFGRQRARQIGAAP